MVAPLDVDGVVVHEDVHDAVRPGPPVENIAHHMQAIHRQVLDEGGQGLEEAVRAADVDEGVHDGLMIAVLVVILVGLGVEQLVQDGGVLLGHGLTHLFPGVLGGEHPRQVHQLRQTGEVPFVGQRALLPKEPQLLPGIVDQRAQLGDLPLVQLLAQPQVHLLPHHAGAVVHDVAEGLVFAVEVAHEVLGALGQAQHGGDIDDLGVQRLPGGKLLGEQVQVFDTLGRIADRHGGSLLRPGDVVILTLYMPTPSGTRDAKRFFSPVWRGGLDAKLCKRVENPAKER